MTVRSVSATLNFARTTATTVASTIGWSNTDSSRVRQSFVSEMVDIADASAAHNASQLDREGFARVRDPIASPRWGDPEWLATVYMPHCCALATKITGADLVAPLFRGVLHRRAGPADAEGSPAPAAAFVHLDQSPSAVEGYAETAAGADFRKRFRHYRMLNLWRALSPPPHNMPLALCDQRTVDRDDLVIGHTVEPKLISHAVEYLTSLYNPAQHWWFYPDLTSDDLLVFNGFDPDSARPIGCLHSAFVDRTVSTSGIARESIESRVFAFFK